MKDLLKDLVDITESPGEAPRCPYCPYQGWSSHYHCSNCGKRSSFVGHTIMGEFTCEPGTWSMPDWRQDNADQLAADVMERRS